MKRTLVAVDWRVPLNTNDYIQGYLVEHPDRYYMDPNKQWVCILIRERGLMMIVRDFNPMNEEQIAAYVEGIKQGLKG